jgi:ABC-2 type transport system ATP-binding protein
VQNRIRGFFLFRANEEGGGIMLIEIDHLTKRFGKGAAQFIAVDDVSFEVGPGEIVGLLGPNGAGKTTTIHMILGLISPTSGQVRIFGKPFDTHRQEILEQMNFTSPYVAFPVRLTVFENLMVFARMYDIREPRAKIADLAKLFGIEAMLRKPVSRLSSGETTRVGLCKAFMNDPKQILLDMQRERGTTILYTSHNMAEVEKMCSRIIFLSRGRVLASGTPIEVTQTILKEDRDEPALEEVFLHVAQRQTNEAA